MRVRVIPVILVAAIVLVAASLVIGTLDRPEPPSFSPTPAAPREVGGDAAGPAVVTVDASDAGRWRFWDFSRASVVESPGPLEWDLAFRRNEIAVNGGAAFRGQGGARPEAAPFDSLRVAPAGGYRTATAVRDSASPAFDDWYDYGFTTHLLTPRARTYAIRTADGKFAKLEILGYYCPGARAGCLTFRYFYRGDGSRDLESGRTSRL
ncbi:MAG TPA: HmuY family protein [Gemmatimonadota bacterium]|nr:HmuY family protein [Gemmatimonadota bacterium]